MQDEEMIVAGSAGRDEFHKLCLGLFDSISRYYALYLFGARLGSITLQPNKGNGTSNRARWDCFAIT